MPEANVLYSVTAAVVLGLVVWVAVVLKSAKEPWARELPPPAAAPDVPLETPEENAMTSEGGGGAVSAAAPPSSPLPEVADAPAEPKEDAAKKEA